MKLVLVGWVSALVSFAIGYGFGRRSSTRDLYRSAMLQAATSVGMYELARRAAVSCSATHDITTRDEGPHTLRCTREAGHAGDHFNGGVKWIDLADVDEQLDDEAWSERDNEGKKP